MEALAIVIVVVVSAIIFVVTWFGVQAEAGKNVQAERDQLEVYRVALRKKAPRDQSEQWDESMLDWLADQLEDVDQRLARITHRR